MKTGTIRRIDDLGRVVIPKEIRRMMKIKEYDDLEIFVEKDGVICLKKHSDEPDFSEADKFVTKNMHRIVCILPHGDSTQVIFNNEYRATVKRHPRDKYNLSVAIVWAFRRAGFTEFQVGPYPDWVY